MTPTDQHQSDQQQPAKWWEPVLGVLIGLPVAAACIHVAVWRFKVLVLDW